jgi:hypothetical protein
MIYLFCFLQKFKKFDKHYQQPSKFILEMRRQPSFESLQNFLRNNSERRNQRHQILVLALKKTICQSVNNCKYWRLHLQIRTYRVCSFFKRTVRRPQTVSKMYILPLVHTYNTYILTYICRS